VGLPPPVDAELLAGFEMISERLADMNTFGIVDIPAVRAAQADLIRVSEADLHHDGAFTGWCRVQPVSRTSRCWSAWRPRRPRRSPRSTTSTVAA
jgi:hypothetical protein